MTHGDAFRFVFLLFLLQGQFDEELLELLVAEVDAELFEAVRLENLEAVDVEKSDDVFARHVLRHSTTRFA